MACELPKQLVMQRVLFLHKRCVDLMAAHESTRGL